MRSVLRYLDALISVSSYVQQGLANFPGLEPPKLATIYNGVDSSLFSPRLNAAALKQNIGLEKDFVILYVGRLDSSKGVPDLIANINEVRKQVTNKLDSFNCMSAPFLVTAFRTRDRLSLGVRFSFSAHRREFR